MRNGIGDIINCKFLLVERIGQGGMGVVYRAHQLNLNRDVAIKLISEDLLQDLDESTDAVETAFGRFQREVKTMAKVRHPNVLQIYDHGRVSVQCGDHETPLEYISMEYIPGNTLRFTMSDHGFEDEEDLLEQWLRNYFMPILDGVEAIHHYGIVHRDIKPENILMDGEIPKIADFGLARAIQMRAVSNSWDVKGTWPYMAPEQFADFRKAGPEADIYALGKILYEAVSGKMDPKQVPFIQMGLANPQTSMRETLDGVIRTATCSNKDGRFKNVDVIGSPSLENGHATPHVSDALDADQVRKEWLADGVTEGAYPIVVTPSQEETSASLLRRHPWEGFSDVGFRTIMETGRS